MKHFFPVVLLLINYSVSAQTQACPVNNSFSLGTLTHWFAYTGNNAGGNPAQTILPYDSIAPAPSGTLGNSTIYEYNLPTTAGIQVLTASSTDLFGGFATVPKINGYQYTN